MVNTRSKIMEDSDHQSAQSGSLIGSNDDLITEILLLLPAVSILRFKSVSKHSGSLLSDRRFTLRYDSLSKPHGLFVRDTYIPFDVENRSTPPFRRLDFCSDPSGIKIDQSCNGLLLCSSYGCHKRDRRFYVFNPTTKQFAIIPPVPGGRFVRKTICCMNLAFHQTDCVHYKIVCVRRLDPDKDLFQIQVYSSATQKWKISIKSFSSHRPTFGYGVYCNGAIHWFSSYHGHFYFKLDVEQLQSHLFPLPADTIEESIWYFGESRGHLYLVAPNINNLRLTVYEMLSDYSGWFVKYQIEYDQLTGAFPEMVGYGYGYDFRVIDMIRDEKEEDTFMVLYISSKLIIYNFRDKSFKQICRLSDILLGQFSYHRYTETLSSF